MEQQDREENYDEHDTSVIQHLIEHIVTNGLGYYFPSFPIEEEEEFNRYLGEMTFRVKISELMAAGKYGTSPTLYDISC